MKFCNFCQNRLSIDTSSGELIFVCITCNERFPSTPEDSLRIEIDYKAATSSEKYDVMEAEAGNDTAGKKVNKSCPSCKLPYLTHVYIGESYISKYICSCGYKVLSKDYVHESAD